MSDRQCMVPHMRIPRVTVSLTRQEDIVLSGPPGPYEMLSWMVEL